LNATIAGLKSGYANMCAMVSFALQVSAITVPGHFQLQLSQTKLGDGKYQESQTQIVPRAKWGLIK